MRFPVTLLVAMLAHFSTSLGSEQRPPLQLKRGDGDAASVYERLDFRAASGGRIHVGEFTDFRLERLGEDAAVIPLVFYWTPQGHEYDPDAEVDAIELRLRDPRWRRDEAKAGLRKADAALDGRVVELDASAMFAPGQRYRLTWTCRPVGGKTATHVCEFTTLSIMMEKENPNHPPAYSRYTYLCEVLVRGEDGNLFFARDVLPNRGGEFGLLGYDSRGKLAEQPESGVRRLKTYARIASTIQGKSLGPLVTSNQYVGASISGRGAWIGGWGVCEPEPIKLPDQPNEITYAYTRRGLWRVTRLSENIIALREDSDLWQQKTNELSDAFCAHLREEHVEIANVPTMELCAAARTLGRRELLRAVESRVRAWADAGRDETKRFPHYNEMDALGHGGDEQSLRTLRYVHTKQPQFAHRFSYASLQLARRLGWEAACGYLVSLLVNETPAKSSGCVMQLQRHDASVPTRTEGDRVLLDFARSLQLKPEDLGLDMAEARLLEVNPATSKLSEETRGRYELLVKNRQGTWFFPNEKRRWEAFVKIVRALQWDVADQ